MERVAIIFFGMDDVPLEKFIFKLSVKQSEGIKVEEAELEFSLRSFLIKLSVSESLTRALPRGRCQILVFLTELIWLIHVWMLQFSIL